MRMTETTHGSLRKRLKAKRAAAIAKMAGRNQLAQMKSTGMDNETGAGKPTSQLPSLRASRATSTGASGASCHSQSGGTRLAAAPSAHGITSPAVDSHRNGPASNGILGCFTATPPPLDYSSWLDTGVPSRDNLVPSAEAVSGEQQHTPENAPQMDPYLFPQTRGALCKDYLLIAEQLCTGTFGLVWKCERLDNGKAFACHSVAKSELLPGYPLMTAVGTEIAILDLLRGHENIIQQHGVYEDVTQVYLVREMCDGGTLASVLQETKSLKEKEGAWLFRKIVSAVNHCHTRIPAILHRKIQPENVLFTSGSKVEPKLADFTESVMLSPGQRASGMVGTYYFNAPEIVIQSLYGTPADIWSLGVLLYLMLAGYLPFNGSAPRDIFTSILEGNVPFHSYPWPSISETCKALIRQMLSHKPEDRPTAAHILHHPWVLHLGPLQRPPYPPIDPLLSSAPPLHPPAQFLPGDSRRLLSTYGTSPSQDLSFSASPYPPPILNPNPDDNPQLQTSTSAAPPKDPHDSARVGTTAQPTHLTDCGGSGHTFPPPPPPPPPFSAASAPSSFPSWSQETYGESEGWSSHKSPVSGDSAAEPCLPPQSTAAAAASFPFPPSTSPKKNRAWNWGKSMTC